MRLTPMERITTQTLLGIRFWDRLLDSAITEGLYVTAQRLSPNRSRRIGRRVVGYSTPSGAIAFSGLADEEAVENDSSQQIWQTIPPNRLIAIDVVDRLRRYLPMSFVAQLPWRGLFRGRGDWLATPLFRPIPEDENDDRGVFLWSDSTRPVPHGRTVILTQIVVGDGENPPPAAHALVEVTQTIDGVPSPELFQHFGLTNTDGILMLPVPYPPIPDPPGGIFPSLAQQTFTLTVTVRYSSVTQSTLPGSTIPNLETILAQPQVNIGTSWNSDEPPVLQTSSTLTSILRFTQPLILRTAIGSPDDKKFEPFLRIQPV